jgi:uncharacterized protein
MKFIGRNREMQRLLQAVHGGAAGLVVVWGRRRLGKSRLLTEWCARTHGIYWVADESAPVIQRQYLAETLNAALPGFADVSYPDWTAMLNRLSRDARQARWRGPLVLDEFPYLVGGAPELPSILQKWVDREKRDGGVLLALSGSSQRMMMDSVLRADAPLYGRADQLFKLEPLPPGYIKEAVGISDAHAQLDFYTCWGGVPRYWELAQPFGARHRRALAELVLSPLGVLHDEIDRLLRQELPSAVPLRPMLDAIGLGAHRSSEIAGRLQTAASSLTRGLLQLQQLGYVQREVSYAESEKHSRKALYRLADPFLRLWFHVVAPHRGSLQTATEAARLKILDQSWARLRAEAWEDLCRAALPRLGLFGREWQPARRYWRGDRGEWDAACSSLDGELVILGECKSLARAAGPRDIDRMIRSLRARPVPEPVVAAKAKPEYVLFVPTLNHAPASLPAGITVVDGPRVFSALVESA